LYFVSDSTVISPDLQKPKKVVVAAAHNIALLKVGVPDVRIEGDIGRQEWGCLPALAAWTLTPLRT